MAHLPGVSAIVLKKKPEPNTAVTLDCFEFVKDHPVPLPRGLSVTSAAATKSEIVDDEMSASRVEPVLVADVLFLSVDPFMRCQFDEKTGVDYIVPYVEGEPLYSSAVLRVKYFHPGGEEKERVDQPPTTEGESKNEKKQSSLRNRQQWVDGGALKAGALVSANLCIHGGAWQTSIVVSGWDSVNSLLANLVPVPSMLPVERSSVMLGDLGVTGLTGYLGVVEHKGGVKSNDVLIVSTAAGGTGCAAVQIAKSRGAKVIGITSSKAKVDYLAGGGEGSLNLDAAVSYTEAFAGKVTGAERVKALQIALEGALTSIGEPTASVYFDNTGGEISEAVFHVLHNKAKVILCGQSSTYNEAADLPYPPPLSPSAAEVFKRKDLQRERYLALNHQDKFREAITNISTMMMANAYKVTETRRGPGLQAAPDAFVGMMRGENLGKMVVQVAETL